MIVYIRDVYKTMCNHLQKQFNNTSPHSAKTIRVVKFNKGNHQLSFKNCQYKRDLKFIAIHISAFCSNHCCGFTAFSTKKEFTIVKIPQMDVCNWICVYVAMRVCVIYKIIRT